MRKMLFLVLALVGLFVIAVSLGVLVADLYVRSPITGEVRYEWHDKYMKKYCYVIFPKTKSAMSCDDYEKVLRGDLNTIPLVTADPRKTFDWLK